MSLSLCFLLVEKFRSDTLIKLQWSSSLKLYLRLTTINLHIAFCMFLELCEAFQFYSLLIYEHFQILPRMFSDIIQATSSSQEMFSPWVYQPSGVYKSSHDKYLLCSNLWSYYIKYLLSKLPSHSMKIHIREWNKNT